jgi:hypothetical protein
MAWHRYTAVLVALVLVAPAATADHAREVQEIETEELDEVDTLYGVAEAHPAPENDANAVLIETVCPLVQRICPTPQYETEAFVALWEEANGCEGLQERSVDCDDDGEHEGSDAELATVGCTSGANPCSGPVGPPSPP